MPLVDGPVCALRPTVVSLPPDGVFFTVKAAVRQVRRRGQVLVEGDGQERDNCRSAERPVATGPGRVSNSVFDL